MNDAIIPLIIRGKVIRDDLKPYTTRGGKQTFHSPDVAKYIDQLVLSDPCKQEDLYELSLDEIIDYLVELGRRLTLESNPHLRVALEMSRDTSSFSDQMLRFQFDLIPQLLSRQAIEQQIKSSIGRRYLEGWVEESGGGRDYAIRAFGARAVHVIAGNGWVIALQTLIVNAITRSDAIIKIPSNDLYFCLAVVQTMIDMAPDHPITRHVSVAYWKGGDEKVERALYRAVNLEKIVAWGGFASMESIRNYLGPGLDLVALDPKSSASIIGREAFESTSSLAEAAELAARDIGYLNQAGCINARTLYVQSGTDAEGIRRANDFGRAVFEAMQKLPPNMSSPHPSFDPTLREEIEGVRHSGGFRVFGGRAAEGAIIVSQYSEGVDFSDRLDCRVANLVPIDDIDEAIAKLTIHTQTIGIFPNALKTQIRDRCALRGGQRMTSLGSATVGGFGGPQDGIEPVRRRVRWIRDDTAGAGQTVGAFGAAEVRDGPAPAEKAYSG
jgi:hypothetical protein